MIEISTLDSSCSNELSQLLVGITPDDYAFFNPFDFNEPTVSKILESSNKDLYFGVRCMEKLVAFHMLRGLDEGYASPMFGVYVHHQAQNRGFGKLCLNHAITVSKALAVPSLLLKVYPSNSKAVRLYEKNGFRVLREVGDQLLMEFDLRERRQK